MRGGGRTCFACIVFNQINYSGATSEMYIFVKFRLLNIGAVIIFY